MEHNGGAGQQLAAEMPIFKRIRNSGNSNSPNNTFQNGQRG